jgi:RHS repeat-associated protein
MNTQLSYNYYTHATQNPENFGWLSGYTEHKHLDEFALINMFSEDFDFVSISETKSLAELIPIATVWSVSGNGRIYDPVLGRMLSPDNYVQSPYNSQSYNRYSYVMNNPLKYTDPSGDMWYVTAIGAAVSGVIGNYQGIRIAQNQGRNMRGQFRYGIIGGSIASNAALAGSMVGSGVAGAAANIGLKGAAAGAVAGAAGGLAGGLIQGTGMSLLQGNTIGESLLAGAKSAGIGALIGGSVGGICGAVSTKIQAMRDARSFASKLSNSSIKQSMLRNTMAFRCETCPGGYNMIFDNGSLVMYEYAFPEFEITHYRTQPLNYQREQGTLFGAGISFNIAFPEWLVGKNLGTGFSIGLLADDTNTGIGLYVTSRTLANKGLAFSIAPELFYVKSNINESLMIEHLVGNGLEFMGGTGPIGISYGVPMDYSYSQYTLNGFSQGIFIGTATWETNTVVIPFLR